MEVTLLQSVQFDSLHISDNGSGDLKTMDHACCHTEASYSLSMSLSQFRIFKQALAKYLNPFREIDCLYEESKLLVSTSYRYDLNIAHSLQLLPL